MKKHLDTVIILGSVLTGVLWMNSRFNEIDKDINSLKNEMSILKTVMIMKGVMPTELASTGEL